MENERCSVVIYFDKPGFDEYPFDDEEFRNAYMQLATILMKHGADVYIARGSDNYTGKNSFMRGWKFNGDAFEEHPEPLIADIIFDRGDLSVDSKTTTVNSTSLRAIIRDKWKTYNLFPDLQPLTIVINSAADLHGITKRFESGKIVLKPLTGFGGDGIFIMSKKDMPHDLPSYPYIAQEFVDSSGGIPGLVEGPHDLRMVLINSELRLCYIRTPSQGKLLANVAQGGTENEVLLEDVPHEAQEIYEKVLQRLPRYKDSHIAVDVMRDVHGRWFLVEINHTPGMSDVRRGASYPPYFDALADFIISKAKKARKQKNK